MKNYVRNLQLLLLILVLTQTLSCAQKADMILTNGKVFTSDASQLYVQALAIKGNKIMEVGSTAEIEKLASSKTKRIDIKGKTVVPGFNNAHDHLGWNVPVGQAFRITEFSESGPDKISVMDSVQRLVKLAKPNQWIKGEIGLTALQDQSMRQALDSVAPNNPVYLQIMWGHGTVLNSRALHILGISDTAEDPLGGWYTRYPGTNRISGALYEYAQFPVLQLSRKILLKVCKPLHRKK